MKRFLAVLLAAVLVAAALPFTAFAAEDGEVLVISENGDYTIDASQTAPVDISGVNGAVTLDNAVINAAGRSAIVVKDGAMTVAKKYRGKDEMCRLKYMKDRIEEFGDQIDTSRIVLHTTCDLTEKEIKGYKKELKKLIKCDEIIVSTAGCVITSHCGPGTFSLFFMLK